MEKRSVKLEPIAATDTASLYTIIFENDDMSEFSKFMTRFKDNAKLQRDYQLKRRREVYLLKKLILVVLIIKYLNYENYCCTF